MEIDVVVCWPSAVYSYKEFVLLPIQHERFNDSTPLPVGFLPEICRPFQLDYKLFKRELAGSVYVDI